MSDVTRLHPDFAELGETASAGKLEFTAHHDLFTLTNLIAFGGDVNRPTHIPADLGQVGPVTLWESTGAADHLPFWNTNLDGDAYLYVVFGRVRLEFKETDGTQRYGQYVAHTGDLLRMPRDVAHRTYSGDGKRRISLEVMPHNPFWDLPPLDDGSVSDAGQVGPFRFDVRADAVEIAAGGASAACPRGDFSRGIRSLVAYDLHLGHNEFDGGFTVHDLGRRVRLSVPGVTEELDSADVLPVFRGLAAAAA